MTTTTACTHGNAEAIESVDCGQPQTWSCDDCGQLFTVVKDHSVTRMTLHATTCRRRSIPASWCGCETARIAGCMDCDKEFPYDVQSGDGVTVYN